MDNHIDILYKNLVNKVLTKGKIRKTRSGDVISYFGTELDIDVSEYFPLLTTKKMFFRGIFEETKHILILGNTNTNILTNNGINIWKQNTSSDFIKNLNLPYDEGDMGPMYGFQLRHFNAKYDDMNGNYNNKGIDQLEYCLNLLKNDCYNRRILMTTFNPNQVNKGVLYPCHSIIIQFYVEKNNNNNYLCLDC